MATKTAIERVVDWFQSTEEGQAIQRKSREDSANALRRVEAAKDLADVKQREAKVLPPLIAAHRVAHAEFKQVQNQAGIKLRAAAVAADAERATIDRRKQRAQRVMMETAPFEFGDRAPRIVEMGRACQHLATHSLGTTAHMEREALADVRRMGFPADSAEVMSLAKAIAHNDAAEAARETFIEAIRRHRDLVFELDPAPLVAAIAATLPRACPVCAQRFDLSAFNAPEAV